MNKRIGRITIIGATNIDVIAEHNNPGGKKIIDKKGTNVRFAIGGTAYNIAINLADRASVIYYYSCLRKNSISEYIVDKNIRRNKVIRHNCLIRDPHVPQAAYVAHCKSLEDNGTILESAVTCSNIDKATIDFEKVSSSIGKSQLVVVDTNVSEAQLRK